MSLETGVRPADAMASPENQQRRFCFFFPGGSSTREGLRPTMTGLSHEFGQGNVAIVDSVLSPKSRRSAAKESGTSLLDQLQSGAHVTVAVHSYGLAQFERTVAWMKRKTKDPELLDKYKDQLDIRVDAGTGMTKGMVQGLDYMRRFARFALNEEGMSDDLLHGKLKKYPHLRGVVSVNSFPPNNIEPDALTDALREAVPELSQFDAKNPLPVAEFTPTRNYSQLFDEQDRSALTAIDSRLADAVRTHDAQAVRALLDERGELTKGYVAKAYAGEYSDHFQDEPVPEEQRWFGAAFLGIARAVRELPGAVFRGKSGKMLLDMERMDIPVTYYLREFDIMTTRAEIEDYYNVNTNGEITPEIVFVPRASHKGPLGIHPEAGKAMVGHRTQGPKR